MEKQKNIWMISCIVAIVVIICLVAYILINPKSKEQTKTEESGKATTSQEEKKTSSEENPEEDRFKDIRINEDFSTDGKIEGIENVRWNNARIMQNDGKMEISIMINNESKDEKIEAKTLNVKLLDKSGKAIAEKDIQMKEIPANYGYTSLDMEFDMKDVVVVYDVQISVKK